MALNDKIDESRYSLYIVESVATSGIIYSEHIVCSDNYNALANLDRKGSNTIYVTHGISFDKDTNESIKRVRQLCIQASNSPRDGKKLSKSQLINILNQELGGTEL